MTKIDLRSRSSMIEYLSNHACHYDRGYYPKYSRCIKVHSIGIPEELMDKAWKFLSLEYSDFWDFYYADLVRAFNDETGYKVFVEGRCGGHIVLDTERPADDELEEMSAKDLRNYAKAVLRFDEFYEDLRAEFIYYLQTHDFVEEEYTVVKKRMTEVTIEEE